MHCTGSRNRRGSSLAAALVGVFVFLFGAQPARAQGGGELTMGSLVMLRHTDGAAAVPRIQEALAHADPGVRAVAARLVGVNGLQPLRPNLVNALEAETDEHAVAEQVRALLMLGVPSALPVVDTWLPRAGAPAIRAIAEELAFYAPAALVERIPALVDLEGGPAVLVPAMQLAAVKYPEFREPLEQAWLAHAPDEADDEIEWDEPRTAPAGTTASEDRPAPMRTFPGLWPGFVASLFEAAGCEQTNSWDIAAIRLTYSPLGLPLRAAVDPSRVSRECATAATALAHVSYQRRSHRPQPGEVEWVLLPTASDFVACADVAPEHQSQPGFDSHSESDIVEPKKTRNVAPRYPPASQKGGIQGTVVLEAMIARTGCVIMVRVLRSVHASLDFEAIRAVLQWRYTPTLFKGEPVDAQMTVTVNFSLRGD